MQFLGSTKKEIWDAYKETKAELDNYKKPESTVAKAKEDAIKEAVFATDSIQIDSLTSILSTITESISNFKKQYDDLIVAIQSKKEELKEIHGIEVSANDLAALAATKEQLIIDSDKNAQEIRENADNYFNEKFGSPGEIRPRLGWSVLIFFQPPYIIKYYAIFSFFIL